MQCHSRVVATYLTVILILTFFKFHLVFKSTEDNDIQYYTNESPNYLGEVGDHKTLALVP